MMLRRRIISIIVMVSMIVGMLGSAFVTTFAYGSVDGYADDASDAGDPEFCSETESTTEETAAEQLNTEDDAAAEQLNTKEDVAAGRTAAEASSAVFDATAEIADKILVHVDAPAGVYPEEAQLLVRAADTSEITKTETLIDGYRPDNTNVLSKQVLEITVTDAEGNEIKPDSSYGEIKVYFGLFDDEKRLVKQAEDAIKSDVIEQALKQLDREIVLSDEERKELADHVDVNIDASRLSIAVYHIENGRVTPMEVDEAACISALSDASRIISVQTNSFSTWQVEVTCGKLSEEEEQAQVEKVMLLLDDSGSEAAAESGSHSAQSVYSNTETSLTKEGVCEHDYVLVETVSSTCLDQGYEIYKCSICGQIAYDNYLPALGHDYITEITPATCREDGLEKTTCSRCDYELETVIPKNEEHVWNDGEITSPNKDCYTDGEMTYTCTVCGATKTERIPAGHEWGEPTITEPTCVQPGNKHYTCSICGAQTIETIPVSSEHTWMAVSDTANCTEGGILTSKCSVCGEIKKEQSIATGHDLPEEWTVVTPATCTDDGLEERKCRNTHCIVTGDGECILDGEGNPIKEACTYSETQTIPATGHQIDSTTYLCTICGETYTEVQQIIEEIELLHEKLPNGTESIDNFNALDIYWLADKIQLGMDDIQKGESEELKAALAFYVDIADTYAKTSNYQTEAKKYFVFTNYQVSPGIQSFYVNWNDNNTTDQRTAADVFLELSGAYLSYEVTDADGVIVKTGDLYNAADANAAFSDINVHISGNEDLISLYDDNTTYYRLETLEELPVSFLSIYTNYVTGEVIEDQYYVNYSLHMTNPAPEAYVVSYPEGAANDAITIRNGGHAILTIMEKYIAYITWMDDNNRSALGGNETDCRPRLTADQLKTYMSVYYTEGYDGDEGTLLAGDYGFTIADEPDENGYYEISISGLPTYDNDGYPKSYYIVQESVVPAANADYVPGNSYLCSYTNVGNFVPYTSRLYSGGYITETLSNSTLFTVTKIWSDDLEDSPDQRPEGTFYIWSTVAVYDDQGDLSLDPDDDFLIPYTSSTSVPKESDETEVTFLKDMGDMTSIYFPMYDNEGRRYIYYGKESNISGYTALISNAGSPYGDDVQEYFADLGYFLNGAVVFNFSHEDYSSLSFSKSLEALAIQNKISDEYLIEAAFTLQRLNEDGTWEYASVAEDVEYYDEEDDRVSVKDDHLFVTLSGFTTEAMSLDYNGVVLNNYRYDDEKGFLTSTYRWIETAVSINGVSAEYNPELWTDDGAGGLVYNGEIVVNTGQKSTVLGDDAVKTSGPYDTTALFTTTAANNSFTNVLVGKHQIDIKKYFYDENGVSIAASDELKDAVITIGVYRDNESEPFDTVQLTQADLVTGLSGEYWEKLVEYDSYDPDGRKYQFRMAEVSADGAGSYDFVAYADSEVSVVEYPERSGILELRTTTTIVNAPRPGDTLNFSVDKLWLDDSDISSRNTVVATLYRFRDIDGQLLSEPELIQDVYLTETNNWYARFSVPAAGEGDSVDNYIILETGLLVDGNTVPVDFANELTSEYLASVKAPGADFDRTFFGIVGDTEHEGDDWDGLNFRYNTYSQGTFDEIDWADYRLTNQRIGSQNIALTKTWVTGGIVKDAQFGLYLNEDKIASFVLECEADDTGDITDIKTPVIKWETGYGEASFPNLKITFDSSVGDKGFEVNTEGNYYSKVNVEGLPQYDEAGSHIDCAIRETAIRSDAGNWINVDGGSCTVDELAYGISVNSSVAYNDNQHHRSPDIFTVDIDNRLSGSYQLKANKVWRDDNTISRPDFTLSVYRYSTKPEIGEDGSVDDRLMELVLADDTDRLAEYLRYILDDEKIEPELLITDKYWSTINSYWRECVTDEMPQYDPYGYPYVYFAVERVIQTASSTDSEGNSINVTYEGYYCNEKYDSGVNYRPGNPNEETITTKDVFSISTDDLEPYENSVFILADGVHKDDENNSYSDYYSATVVNKPSGICSVSGYKLWKFPLGFTVDNQYLPEVPFALYRMLENVSLNDFESTSEYEAYIKEHASTVLNAEGEEVKILAETKATYDCDFKYEFKENEIYEINRRLLQYDEWGSRFYYYPLEAVPEDEPILNFPSETILYQNNYSVSNVFSSAAPFVEITFEKTWEVEKEVLDHLEEYGFDDESIVPNKLAPAMIDLYITGQNRDGEDIENSKTLMLSFTLDPKDALQSEEKTIENEYGDGTITVNEITSEGMEKAAVTATFTIKRYWSDVTGNYESLPYYWINNCKLHYSLEEEPINGYDITARYTEDIEFPDAPNENNVYQNIGLENIPSFDNSYGYEYIDVEFQKIWADEYVDNSSYRPETLVLTIKRKVGDVTDHNFEQALTIEKQDFEGKYLWYGTLEHLLKYDPLGREYTYYIYSETFINGDEEETVTIEKGTEKTIGNYTLDQWTDKILKNRLNDSYLIKAAKTWLIDGNAITDYRNEAGTGFDDLRRLGAFPEKITFIVERSEDGGTSYSKIDASDYPDSVHTVLYDGTKVLGREVDISGADENNFRFVLGAEVTWDNLPKGRTVAVDEMVGDVDTINYTYRVIEVLTWADGSTDEITDLGTESESHRGIISKIEEASDVDSNHKTFNLTNNLTINPVRIAKVWEDDNGRENTRPKTIKVTIQPIISGGTTEILGEGKEITLTTVGNNTSEENSNIYYSSWFYLPKDVSYTYGVEEASYKITETWRSVNGAVYEQTIISTGNVIYDETDDTYTFRLINTYDDDRKVISVSADKDWEEEGEWKDLVRPAIKYVLQYRDQITGDWVDFTDETLKDFIIAKDDDPAWEKHAEVVFEPDSASYKYEWTQLKQYWDLPKEDGIAEFINYRVREVIVPDDTLNNWYIHQYNTAGTAKDGKNMTYVFNNDRIKTYSGTFVNTLYKSDLTIKKAWDGYLEGTEKTGTLTAGDVEKLIDLNVIPESIELCLEYQVEEAAEAKGWSAIPDQTVSGVTFRDGKAVISTLELINGKTFASLLPFYDAQGRSIAYRIYESRFIYGDGSVIKADWDENRTSAQTGTYTADGKTFALSTGSTSVTLNNAYAYVKQEVTKNWVDEANRDGARTDFTVALYRDGELYGKVISTGDSAAVVDEQGAEFCTVTKSNTTNVWTISWDYLPKYQNRLDGEGNRLESVYTWKEEAAPADYVAASGEVLDIDTDETNTYQPLRGSVTAAKIWSGDQEDSFETRPEEIWVKLQYKDASGIWTEVTWGTLVTTNGKTIYEDADPGKAYYNEVCYAGTETPLKAVDRRNGWFRLSPGENTTDDWSKIVWTNLPVYKRAKNTTTKIEYRVIEGRIVNGVIIPVYLGTGGTGRVGSYAVSTQNVILDGDGDNQTSSVTNKLNTTSLTVVKNWDDNFNSPESVRPDSAAFEIQWKKANEGDQAWSSFTADQIGEGKVTNVAIIDGKSYVILRGDKGLTEWSEKVTGLPSADSEGTAYQYRVTEAWITYDGVNVEIVTEDGITHVGPYDVVGEESVTALYSAGVYKASAENRFRVGSYTVKKVWEDDSAQNGTDQAYVEVQLYRKQGDAEAVPVEAPVRLSSDNEWTYTWTNLPVRNNAGTVAYEYYVKEVGESGGRILCNDGKAYVVIYDPESSAAVDPDVDVEKTVTNQRIPEVISISAAKEWIDDNNRYLLRDEEISVTLQYSIDGGTTWQDDIVEMTDVKDRPKPNEDSGNRIYTSSALVQVIRGDASENIWTGAEWKDLTTYVSDEEGKVCLVSYRVVEAEDSIPLSYEMKESESAAYDVDSGGAVPEVLTVTNILQEVKSLQVTKNWDLEGDMLSPENVLPESVTVQLQYYNTQTDTWENVPNNSTKEITRDSGWEPVVFDRLRANLDYRAIEISMTYLVDGEPEVVYVVSKDSNSDGDQGQIGGFIYTSETDFEDNDGITVLTNKILPTELTVIKKWEDNNNSQGLRPGSVTVKLYRDLPDGVSGAAKEAYLAATAEISGANGWTYTFSNLPMYKNGSDTERSVYTLEEVSVYKYRSEITGNPVSFDENGEASITVTNTISESVKTGDDSNPSLWWSLLALAMAAIIGSGAVLYRKKKEQDR